MALANWTDGRLDDLAKRVDALNNVPKDLAVLQSDVSGLRHEVHRGLDSIGKKLDDLTGDPAAERRARNKAILIAIIASAGGGISTLIVYLIIGGHP